MNRRRFSLGVALPACGLAVGTTGAMVHVLRSEPDADLIATCRRFIELAEPMTWNDYRATETSISEWTTLGRTIPKIKARTALGVYWKLKAFMEGAVDNIDGQEDLILVSSAMEDLDRIAGLAA